MRKTKINAISLFLVLAIVFSIAMVSSAVTMSSPGASAVISGATYLLNITDSDVASDGVVNCSFYAKSASTANSSYTLIRFDTNTSTGNVNSTFDSTDLEDSNDYFINATCTKMNKTKFEVIRSGLSINNTVPTTPTTLVPVTNTVYTNNSVYFTSAVNNTETTGCTLYFDGINPGSSSYAMTYSASSCTKSLTIPDQTYRWYIVASDGSDTKASAITTLKVDTQQPTGRATAIVSETQNVPVSSVGSTNFFQYQLIGLAVWVWIVIAVLIIVIYFMIRGK